MSITGIIVGILNLLEFRAKQILILALLVMLLAACQGLGGEPQIIATIPPGSNSAASEEQMIAETMLLGGETWAANCAECHGKLGEGTEKGAPLPDLTELTDEAILASVTGGVGDTMPAFGERLAAEQLQAVATYAKMISLARSRDMINADNPDQSPEVAVVPGATEEVAANPNMEMTDDPSVIQIERVASQVEVLDGRLYILQIVQFLNTSESVYFVQSENGHNSVSVRIPRGAQIQDIAENNYQISSDGTQVFDIQPVIPGEAHIMHLAYSLPYDETAVDGLTINQIFDFNLAGPVDVLVATDGLSLNSDTLSALDTRTSNGINVTRYGSELSLPSGASLTYTIRGVPVPLVPANVASSVETNTSGQAQNPIAYMLVGAGGSALIIASGLYLRERFFNPVKRRKPASAEDLIEQIAALDNQHREGKLDPDAYLRQRTVLKTQLSDLMKSQQPNS